MELNFHETFPETDFILHFHTDSINTFLHHDHAHYFHLVEQSVCASSFTPFHFGLGIQCDYINVMKFRMPVSIIVQITIAKEQQKAREREKKNQNKCEYQFIIHFNLEITSLCCGNHCLVEAIDISTMWIIISNLLINMYSQ